MIIKKNDITPERPVILVIYGQPGCGKTSAAVTAENPLLIDTDRGYDRACLRVDTLEAMNWQDIDRERETMRGYKTIVVDTVGKMMDFIVAYKCGSRQPQIRDWGGINQEFAWLTRALSALNKNVVFVAHRDTRREGDDTVFIPALREKSYNSIVTDLDLLGYLEMKNENGVQRRTVTFDPTSRNDGKNTCNLPGLMQVPAITDQAGNPTAPNNFITEQVIKPYYDMIRRKKEEAERYDRLMEQIRSDIEENMTDQPSANDFIAQIDKGYEHVGSSRNAAYQLAYRKAESLGLVYNAQTRKYEQPAA